MIFILLSVVCVWSLALVSADPCLNYATISNEKRSVLYTATDTEPNICDDDLDESVWYRFNVLAPHRIHDECVTELTCGTAQPVWINGNHPTADDPGPKTVTVCSSGGDDDDTCCAGWTSSIQVKFCPAVDTGDDVGGFYVYRLNRVPRCDMAYCAGNTMVCPDDSTWNPTREKCTEVRPNITSPVFEGPITEEKTLKKKRENLTYDDFYFVCKVRWSDLDEGGLKKGGEQFEVVFTFDGQEVNTVPPKIADGANKEIKLTSKELIGQVGKTVGCKVRSHWMKLLKFRSEYFVSERTYFVGIRYSLEKNTEQPFTSPRIEIDETYPPLTLYFQSTVPISCPEVNRLPDCKVTIKMADISPKDRFGASACSMVFSGRVKNNQPRTQRVKALPTPGIHQRTSVIRFLNISGDKEFFWHGYKLPDIPIFIADNSTTGTCSSVGDPHVTTFDRRYYDAYMEGDYLFARSTSQHHFEVHVRHHKCWSVTCNCAVAVREGNNVLGVNACQGPNFTPTPITYLEDKNVPGATITNVGNSYTITMPSGAYVRMDWYRWYSGVYLFLNSEDYGKVIGLCGTFNGNPGDDTIPKGGQQADTRRIPKLFTESYKLDSKKSFINGHVHPIECLAIDDQVPNICSCQGKQGVACAAPSVKTKTFGTQFTQHCNKKKKKKHPNEIELNRRRRRSIGWNETTTIDFNSEEDDIDENYAVDEPEVDNEERMVITVNDIPVPVIDENHGRNVTLRWPTPGGLSEADAQRQCRSKMESSPVFDICRDQISQQLNSLVTSCVTDIQASDDVEQSVSYIVNDFQGACRHKLESSIVRNDEEVQSSRSSYEEILLQFLASVCPEQCNGNGTCRNGTCVCKHGFGGDDCSINSRIPPSLTSFRKDPVCDSRNSVCSKTSIFASNILQSEKLRCKVKAVDQNQDFTFGGSLVSTREVICRLPMVHRFTNNETTSVIAPAPFYRWDISLTNDGSLYSDSLRLTVFDSKCQECRSDGLCVQKRETCEIGGRCFESGDRSNVNQSEKCIPSINRHDWTHVIDETTIDFNHHDDDVDDVDAVDNEERMVITVEDIPVPVIDENHGRNVTLRWPTPGGLSEADAQRQCRSKMESSPVFAICRDQISQQIDSLVTNCVTDVQVSDDVEQSVSYILNDFQSACRHKLESSVVGNHTNDEEVQSSPYEELLQFFVSVCPAQCNGNGTCRNGTCVCNDGFAGEDCSINTRIPPSLTSFRKDPVCDIRNSVCSETSIFASNILQSEKLKCRVKAVDQNQDFTFGGSLISTREVICRLPVVHRFTNNETTSVIAPAPFYRLDISLTNDGSLYSDSLRLTVYDSKCQECRSDGLCVQKSKTCQIRGRCFESGDRSNVNQCEKCIPSKNRHDWTYDCVKTSSASSFSFSLNILTAVIAFTSCCFLC